MGNRMSGIKFTGRLLGNMGCSEVVIGPTSFLDRWWYHTAVASFSNFSCMSMAARPSMEARPDKCALLQQQYRQASWYAGREDGRRAFVNSPEAGVLSIVAFLRHKWFTNVTDLNLPHSIFIYFCCVSWCGLKCGFNCISCPPVFTLVIFYL